MKNVQYFIRTNGGISSSVTVSST